jgi:membrane-bound lytic murein transglycosylase B
VPVSNLSRRRTLAFAAALSIGLLGACASAAMDIRRPDIRAFIDTVAKQDSFDKRSLRKLLRAAQAQPAIIEAMDRPAEKAKAWFDYRPIFVNDKRIQEGVDFWIAHRAQLDQASLRTGVPAEYLVAIVGVETSFGRKTGHYRVLDALATLAFDYPARA